LKDAKKKKKKISRQGSILGQVTVAKQMPMIIY
jgi:hypothetical protein